MKVQVKEQTNPQELKYPVLMKNIDSELVVLFTSVQAGVVLVPDTYNGKGEYSTDWLSASDPKGWTKFQGVIELSND